MMTKVRAKGITVELEACPCCGNTDLYAGHVSSCVMGVQCCVHRHGCGLQMSVSADEVWDNVKPGDSRMQRTFKSAMRLAARRWNRRV